MVHEHAALLRKRKVGVPPIFLLAKNLPTTGSTKLVFMRHLCIIQR